ncbi:hypothetical protein AZE42_11322, partial [Rhizopogon vesiculosus]
MDILIVAYFTALDAFYCSIDVVFSVNGSTSSKSTKLVHGGVRYLQKAVFELDYEQYKLVREALRERRVFLQTAPYLSHMLPIMLPIYKSVSNPVLARKTWNPPISCPRARPSNSSPYSKATDSMVVVHYDGQHNDSRMNITLILTAIKAGATAANYCDVTALHEDPITSRINGVRVKDEIAGNEIDIKAKININATGPYTDSLLSLNTRAQAHRSRELRRTHRPAFLLRTERHGPARPRNQRRPRGVLPSIGGVIAGTTDESYDMNAHAKAKTNDVHAYMSGDDILPRESEIQWVIDEV